MHGGLVAVLLLRFFVNYSSSFERFSLFVCLIIFFFIFPRSYKKSHCVVSVTISMSEGMP